MNRVYALIVTCTFSLTSIALASEKVTSILDLDLEELMQIKIYTPKRMPIDISLSPSVTSVITAEDIKSRGYKTLYEVLDEVPGFYNSGVAAWGLTTNRGVIGDNNAGYLFLVDGHALTNTLQQGFNEEYRFPLLAKVSRIEVVRGAGSTLWGSFATKGIIHIFTKQGKDIASRGSEQGAAEVSYDYETDHQRHSVDIIYGNVLGDTKDLMISYNYSDSNAPWTEGRIAGEDGLFQPPWLWFTMNQWDYEPSHDLYIKYRSNDFKVSASLTDYEYMLPTATPFSKATEGSKLFRHYWFDIKNTFTFEGLADAQIESRVYFDRRLTQENITTMLTGKTDEINKTSDHSLGTEHILHYKNSQDNSMLLGVFYESTKFNAGNDFTGRDTNRAFFVEDTYAGIKNVIFTLGFRWEKNTGNADNSNFLPRFSAVYHRDAWSVKYAYSTGVTRMGEIFGGFDQPFLVNSGDSYRVSTEQSTTSDVHDLQWIYRTKDFYTAITLYSQKVKDIPAFINASPVLGQLNGKDIFYGLWDVGAIESFGVEYEFKKTLSHKFNIYGNFAYQNSNWNDSGFLQSTTLVDDDDTPTAVPSYTWNFGVNYDISERLKLNVKYRGWDQMSYLTHSSRTGFLTSANPRIVDVRGPEHYVDFNLLMTGIINTEIALYAKNVFDNDSPLAHINSGEIDQPLRRQIGILIKYLFN